MTYRPAPEVAWILDDTQDDPTLARGDVASARLGTVVVAQLPDGEPLALEGPAAAIWLCAIGAPDEDTVVARVSHDVGIPAGTSGADTRAFLADLLARGLLVLD